MSKSKQILLALVLITVFILVGFIVNTVIKATDPSPPKTEENTLSDWMSMLENTTWQADKRTKDVTLMELGYSKIQELWFQPKSADGTIVVILINKAANFRGKVTKGDEVLSLTVDGNHLDLWYSESEAGLYPTLTIRGSEEKLFFIPSE